MSLRITKRAKAKQDLIELAEYIASDNIDAAERFIDAAEAAFNFLSETPGAGASREHFSPGLSGLRMWPIRRFEKHLIFYRQTPDGLDIVRVIHSARDIASLLEKDDAP